jgi:ABC-type lipoprotein release transport system permease subunit
LRPDAAARLNACVTAIGVLARAAIRARWRSILAISLLVGVTGAVVLTAAAGARRTDTSLERFKQWSSAADVEIAVGYPSAEQLREFEQSDGVAAVAPLFALVLVGDGGYLPFAAAEDERFGTVVDRPRVVAGRLADPDAPDEIAIGESFAEQSGLGVGDQLTVDSYTQPQVEEIFTSQGTPPPAGPRIRFDVVGVVRRPLDVGIRSEEGGIVAPTPAFREKYPELGSFEGTFLRVHTDRGAADVPRVVAAAREIFGGDNAFGARTLAIESEGARDAISVLTTALWLFAGIMALAGVVAIGIVVGRQVGQGTDHETLEVLGLTRRGRAIASAAVALPIAVIGAFIAVVGSALASPLMPLGVARKIEPDGGVRLDPLVLGVGGVIVVAFVVAVAIAASVRTARTSGLALGHADMARSSSVAQAAASAGMPAPVTSGLRMAFERGRGPAQVPVRSAFAGAALGVLGVVAVLTFASSLDRLVTTPRLYGWTWDVAFGVPDNVAACTSDSALVQAPELSAVASVCAGHLEVDGRSLRAWSFTSLRGTIEPTTLSGRAPHGPDEIALGADTLAALDKRAGDTVSVQAFTGIERYRIVGTVVLPTVGSDAQPIADGALFAGTGFARLAEGEGNAGEGTQLLARLAPGVDVEHVTRRVEQFYEDNYADIEAPPSPIITSRVPVEIDRLRQVGNLPAILGVLLAGLAAVAIGHAVVSAVRRRRHDLAILKTLGFGRGEVRATVAWQATALSAGGLVVGIPFGIVAGFAAWRLVADGLGVATTGTVPILAVVLTIPAAIALANLVAAVPARWAARTRPAVVLRSQ